MEREKLACASYINQRLFFLPSRNDLTQLLHFRKERKKRNDGREMSGVFRRRTL